MKKLILTTLFGVALSLNLSASLVKKNTDLDYDVAKGWWWYEETYEDTKTKEIKKVKYKVSPEEKAKRDAKEESNRLLRKSIEVQKEIQSRLEYAFPNVTPLKTVNKKTGKECVTNSSMDCFVMPVIAEGQQIPVLKEFLREPSPSKSKEWLKWQATYFNHVQKVSHGLRFAYLKYGAEAYPTTTTYSLGDSLTLANSEKALAHRQAKIIHSMKDSIGLLVFVGKNALYEKTNKTAYQVHNWNKSFLKDIGKVFVFQSEAERKEFFKEIQKYVQRGEKELYKFWKDAKVSVRPDLYEKYNVRMTPSTVMFYYPKNKDKTGINQLVLSGSLGSDDLRRQMMHFLTYNEIVDEGSMGADKNWASPSGDAKVPKANESKIYKDYLKK
ncbi:hypothetical protein ALC152_05050 [Arcobacter sp. 15-2]|uniref:hypothetical protein n=1 Tax=Arcobacter sp. 15-2 TaxID=3374109 RepID=UPI00399C8DFE